MDSNGLPSEGFPMNELPLGLGMALGMNETAMSSYARLTEAEKEKLILQCKDARSKDEMQRIVDDLASNGEDSLASKGILDKSERFSD